MVHRLKITDVGHHLSLMIFLFFNPIKTPLASCVLFTMLHLSQSEHLVNSASKILEDDVKNKSEQQLYRRKCRVFKFCEKKKQNRDYALRCRNNWDDYVSPKKFKNKLPIGY